MPIVTLPTDKGQNTNTDAWASGQPEQVLNLLIDERGTLTSRPGLSSWCTPTDGGSGAGGRTDPRIVGLHPYKNRMIAVRGNRRIFSIDEDGNETDITEAPLGGWEPPSFLLDPWGRLLIFGGGIPQAVSGDGLTVNTFAKGLSSSPTHGALVDRMLIVNDKGSDAFQYSQFGDYDEFTDGLILFPTADPPIVVPGTSEAGTRSDPITALTALQNRLFLFGDASVEVFYGTGSSFFPGPLRLEDTPIASSLGAARSLLQVDGTLWWIDGRRRLVRMQGRSWERMSLPVEAQLRALDTWSDCIAHKMEYQGHHLILLHFETEKLTLAYDWLRNVWSEWRKWNTSTGSWDPMPLKAYAFHPTWNKHFCAGGIDGKIFELSPTTYQDDSGPLRREWKGPFFDAGGYEPKLGRRYQFLVDGGTATSHQEQGDITAFADYSGTVAGTVSATSTGHPLSTGDSILIEGTLNYDGQYTVTVIDANTFYFTDTWVSNDAKGAWRKVLDDDTEPEIEARIRNEDREWQDWSTVSLGQLGDYSMVKDLWSLTQFRTQQLHWRCSANVALRVSRIQLEHRDRGR